MHVMYAQKRQFFHFDFFLIQHTEKRIIPQFHTVCNYEKKRWYLFLLAKYFQLNLQS